VQLGDYRVEIVPDAEFRLDGGAMFGVIPRTLWAEQYPPDEHNRIRLNMNCLFIEAGRERILIETGIGDKWSVKQQAMYGIDRQRTLAESVEKLTGYTREQITIVVNTHLHFDHAGGNTTLHDGLAEPTFPQARYFVSREEYLHANSPHERDRASYLPENWRPLEETGQLELKDAEYEVVPGLSMETVAGHSQTMQCVRLKVDGETLYQAASILESIQKAD
jgi:glyoxylase-like metal-dependent hydrolase (beta-lactamase superfamily II)